MKKWTALFLILTVLLSLYSPSLAEDAARPALSAYGDSSDVKSLLAAAERALAEGAEPKTVGEELAALAEANGLTDAFGWAAENIAAINTEEYRHFQNAFPHDGQRLSLFDYDNDRVGGVSVYDAPEASDALKALLADAGAQYCHRPVYWSEADFADFYGVSFAKFKPSRPRAGYVCVVVKDGAQAAPETVWKSADGKDDFDEAMGRRIEELLWLSLGDDAPILTGNPNLASAFLIFDMQYPFYALYGSEEPHVKGYNCTVTLNLVDAKSRSSIASITRTNKLADRISRWSNWIAKADAPQLIDAPDYAGVLEKIRAALIRQRARDISSRKLTSLNIGSVLNGILAAQADKTQNAWQAAVYMAGAKEATLEGETLTFALRGYDPLLTELGGYAGAADKNAWLTAALTNAAAYRLTLSLPVQDGEITQKGMTALKQAVTQTAAAAQKAFAGKEMSAALSACLFPKPIDGKGGDASDLLSPTDEFAGRMGSMGLAEKAPVTALSSLFYAQKSQTLSVKGGPNALTLSCVGLDPAALLQSACEAVLDAQAFVPVEERFGSRDELLEALARSLADESVAAMPKAGYKFKVTFGVDELLAGRLPAGYAEYLNAFAYEEAADELVSTIDRLPDIAAIPMPKSGKLSGSSSGTQVTFRLAKDSQSTYIQMRRAGDNALTVSCFVEAGKQATVRVPKEEYTIVWGSGPYWYGEEVVFGTLGAYNKSDPTEIKGKNYRHTFTLERAKEGVPYHEADLSDLQ